MAQRKARQSRLKGKRSAPPRSPRRQSAPQARSEGEGRTLPIEIDPSRIEATLTRLKDQLLQWANRGRYTRVRFKFRGKQLLPDLPLAAVIAAEGLTFYWGGILRALIVNLAGQTVLDVELVNDSEKQIHLGKGALLSGDVDKALECFRAAQAMDESNPGVHLNLGIALKLKGDLAGARQSLESARSLDPKGAVGSEAERLLSRIGTESGSKQVAASPPGRLE
jgi:tetratricopeptide (TPR) repeat protein